MKAPHRLRRALVTGANGFVGRHVVGELASRDCAVVAVSRQDEVDPAIADLVESYVRADVADLGAVRKLGLAGFDSVINLAGLAAVGESFARPELYLQVNRGVMETFGLVAQEQELSHLRVIAVSSGAVYAGGQPMPLAEDSAVDPTSSPYAASKLAMEDTALSFRRAGVDCVVVRPFNHIGPGQGPGFLVPDLYASITRAVREGEAVSIGSLATRRDYTDVRDVARAYVDLAAAETVAADVVNVCSGRSVSGEQILTLLLEVMGRPDLATVQDPARMRPSDNPDIVGDATRIAALVRWRPALAVEQSIRDFVDAMRSEAE